MIRRSSYNILRVIIVVLVFYYCCKKLQQICSAIKPCPTLGNLKGCSMPGSSVLHYLPEFAQIHIHWVGDAV